MTANFDRWEKDPFFSAAEEVQESADRMESLYRTWLYSIKNTSTEWNLEDLRRELSTAVDTAKWQLEEFERAVLNSYKNSGADEAKDRHRQFVLALDGKISLIQKALQESVTLDGNPSSSSPWSRVNEGENDDLELFLSGPLAYEDRIEVRIDGLDQIATNSDAIKEQSESNHSRYPENSDEKHFGHRRTASACANITICEDELASRSSSGQMELLSRKVPSLSDVAFLRSQPQNRGTSLCYERNKSCLDNCDDCYDKQLRGWYGALHRLVQRSLYQVQYVRPIKVTFWALLLFSFVLFLVCVF